MSDVPKNIGEIKFKIVAPSGINSPGMVKRRRDVGLAILAVLLGTTLYQMTPSVESYVDKKCTDLYKLVSNPSLLLAELLGSDE